MACHILCTLSVPALGEQWAASRRAGGVPGPASRTTGHAGQHPALRHVTEYDPEHD